MIKILIISTVKVGYDGLTNHILSYVENIDKSDMHIDFLSARGIDNKIETQLNNVGFENIYRIECRDTNQIKYFIKLVNLVKKNKYNIVHVHGNSATLSVDLLAACVGGCKVRIAHSHNTMCDHNRINRILSPIFRRVYTHGFACGTEAGKWMFGDSEFEIIPNGKEVSRFSFNEDTREEYRRILNLSSDTIAIGNVAAFVKKKNHQFLLDVFSELIKRSDKYELFLFGIEGETLPEIIDRINELDLQKKVHYMGTKDNVNDYFNAFDIMVLPSMYEGFPISVIEWQINGLPCLISNRITRECNILGTVKYLPIDEGIDPWIDAIENVQGRYKENVDMIFKEYGFDIKTNAEKLKQLYLEYVK